MQKGRFVRSAGILAVLFACSIAQVQAEPIVIGWAELASADLERDDSNVAVLVPRQLMFALSFIKLRHSSTEETELGLRKAQEVQIESAKHAVATSRAERDLKALSIQDPARKAAELLTADSAVATAEAALVLALASTPTITPSPEPVPLVQWSEHAHGTLLPVVDEPAVVCSEKKLDLLVYGSIKPKGNFLAVEFILYDATLGRDIWRYTDYAVADGIEDLVASFTRPCAEAILGRSYAQIIFKIEPPVANLFLDGTSQPDAAILYFKSGSHEARAQAEGFETATQEFFVTPGFDAVITMALVEKPSVGITLSSDPPGAEIHLDGAQAGFAPLDVPGAAYPRVARVSMPGYEDAQLVLRPQSLDDQLLIPLAVSDGLSFDNRFDDKKGAFYRSLGWFIASLPVTVLSGGLFQTYRQTGEVYKESGAEDPEIIKLLVSGDYTSQAVFWTSVAASTALAINAIVRLVLYVGSAQ